MTDIQPCRNQQGRHNEQDVQEKRLNAMKYKILKTEQENLKTREKTTDQMVETIRRIIMDEAKKNY